VRGATPASGLASEIAASLKAAKRPVIIAGPSCGSAALIHAAGSIARSLAGASLAFTAPECNSFGLALMDAPSLDDAPAADTVIILENDLYRRAPAGAVDEFLSKFKHVVALDCMETRTTTRAELVLPAASFAEGDGTFVSSEGRAQRFFQVYVPAGPIQDSWRWLSSWTSLDEATSRMAAALPRLAPAVSAAPPATFRMAGDKFPREPHRYSGRTAMLADVTVHEPAPPPDPDAPLSFSMEGNPDQPPAPLIPFFWSPAWNSIQSVNKFQSEIAGPLRGGNPGVRLIEPGAGEIPALPEVPSAFEPRADEWLIVPLWHTFGSDEFSGEAPAVAQLAPEPYLALAPEDAAAFGERVEVLGHTAPVRIVPELPRGMAGIIAGVPPFEGIVVPTWTKVTKAL
jgi:NADH-quinone oxidoreductase subunit G